MEPPCLPAAVTECNTHAPASNRQGDSSELRRLPVRRGACESRGTELVACCRQPGRQAGRQADRQPDIHCHRAGVVTRRRPAPTLPFSYRFFPECVQSRMAPAPLLRGATAGLRSRAPLAPRGVGPAGRPWMDSGRANSGPPHRRHDWTRCLDRRPGVHSGDIAPRHRLLHGGCARQRCVRRKHDGVPSPIEYLKQWQAEGAVRTRGQTRTRNEVYFRQTRKLFDSVRCTCKGPWSGLGGRAAEGARMSSTFARPVVTSK